MERNATSYRNLIVWEKSMKLAESVYVYTNTFPESEKYGLVSQMRRCAVSIPSNIAEGSLRSTEKDFKNFLRIAFGSGAELETQLELATRLNFGDESVRKNVNTHLSEVMKMLNTLTRKTNS